MTLDCGWRWGWVLLHGGVFASETQPIAHALVASHRDLLETPRPSDACDLAMD